MRLVCPECKAEYEVDDSAVPPTGRDVQCSACGHIWLQAPAGGWPEETDADSERPGAPEAAEDAGEEAPPDAVEGQSAAPLPEPPEAEPEPEAQMTAEEAPPHGPAAATAPEHGTGTEEAQQADERPPRRNPAASPEVIAILREEAEREARVRRRGRTAGLEVQSDLGLAAAPPPRPEPPGEDVSPPPAPRGRNRLPAIDEIDPASLRPAPRRSSSGATGAATASAAALSSDGARQRGRYRAGFLLSAAIATAVALVYAQAGEIAVALPEAGPALDAYVAGVDALRLWLDDMARAAVEAISALAGRAGA